MQQLNTKITVSNQALPIFPHRSQNCYNCKLSHSIDGCLNKYYSNLLINLEENISFHEEEENLKRFYQMQQFSLKIQLLSQYYKYHEQMPKLFIKEVSKIMSKNIEEKRDVQYRLVKQKMITQQIPSTVRSLQPQNKILDIELSYQDFENKNATRIKKVSIKQDNIKKLKRMVSIKNCHANFCKTPKNNIFKQGLFAKDKKSDKIGKNNQKKQNKVALKISVANKPIEKVKDPKSLHSSVGSDVNIANKSKTKQTLNSISSKKAIQTARVGTVRQFRQNSNKSSKSGSVKSLKSVQLKKNADAKSCKILSLKPAQKNLILIGNQNSSKKQNKLKINQQDKETPVKPTNSMFTKLIQVRRR